jgi:CRISPR-associated protein Cas2
MPDDSRHSSFNPSDWRQALAQWKQEHPTSSLPDADSVRTGRIPLGWWENAFTNRPTPSEQRGHPCGENQMLTVVAYDITDQRRLQRIAKICEDYGVRVQYSVFECRLEADKFDKFWNDLLATIDSATDRLVAYKVCVACARDIRSAGTQTHQETVVAYVF